jgi:hypothetical protein
MIGVQELPPLIEYSHSYDIVPDPVPSTNDVSGAGALP